MKRNVPWNVASVLQIIPMISAKTLPYFYLLIDTKFGDLMSCDSKDIFKNALCLMYLLQTERFIESLSISTALVACRLRFSKSTSIMITTYYLHTIILTKTIPKKGEKRTKKKTIKNKNKTKKQTTSPCLHHRWKCYQTIALKDQHVRPTSLASL